MKQWIVLIGFFLLAGSAFGQWDLDMTYGSSKADYGFAMLRLSRQVSDRWRVGASYQFSDYRYRFIDARQVSDGFAGTLRLSGVVRLSETGGLRLDGFLHAGHRYIGLGTDAPQVFNYDFEPGHALILEPGLVVTLRASEAWNFHSGVNMHMAWQVAPEPLFEQFPSAHLLAGGSYRLKPRWTLFLTSQTGPMSGASGDTEKFFWQAQAGLRYAIGTPTAAIFGF